MACRADLRDIFCYTLCYTVLHLCYIIAQLVMVLSRVRNDVLVGVAGQMASVAGRDKLDALQGVCLAGQWDYAS